MPWLKAWAPYFQSGVRMRGRTYQSEGRVHRLVAEPGELVRAEVKGSDDQTHLVTLATEAGGATAQCTCTHFASGAYCKHIWATLIDLQRAAAEAAGTVPSMQGFSPRPPRARKRQAAQSPQWRSEPDWVGRLSLLREPTTLMDAPGEPIVPLQREVCYVVDPELSARHAGLVVELRQRQPTRAGWTRPKPLKINLSTVTQLTDPTDRELCALMLGASWVNEDDVEAAVARPNERGRSTYRLQSGAWRTMLRRMILTDRCYVEVNDDLIPLSWDAPTPRGVEQASPDGEPWMLYLLGMEVLDALDVTVELRRWGHRMAIDEPTLLLGGPDGLVIYRTSAAALDDRGAWRWVSQFRDEAQRNGEAHPIRVEAADIPRFLDRLYALPQLPELDLPEGVGKPEQRMRPAPMIEFYSPDASNDVGKAQLPARVRFAYGTTLVSPSDPGRFVTMTAAPPGDAPADGAEAVAAPPAEPALPDENDEPVVRDIDEAMQSHPAIIPAAKSDDMLIRRDRQFERDALGWLLTIGFRQVPAEPDTLILTARQMPAVVAMLLTRGWHVVADQKIVRQPGPPRLSVTSGVDWFEVRGTVRFQTDKGDQEVSLPELLAAVRAGRTMITLGDGTQGLLPEQWLADHNLLTTIGTAEEDHLRFHSTQAALLDALLRQQELVNVDEQFDQARQRLRRFDGIKPMDPSDTFKGSLRPYQREALGWFQFLRDFGMGGILADDMGLGKTVQVLAMLDTWYGRDRGSRVEHYPTLIVAPRSVVFNWIDESAKFAPNLRVQAYTGSDRQSLRDAFADHDVIITSYGLMRRDIAELRGVRFDYVVLDEAQAIKNPASQSARSARLLNATHRLALTGTPVENHLGDLWSIFEYLNPGMLGSATRFGQLVRGESRNGATGKRGRVGADRPVIELDQKSSADVAIQVARSLRPFVLRRTKKQVLQDLPDKTEQTILCEMEPEQRRLYNELREHYRTNLLGKQAPGTAGGIAGGASGGTSGGMSGGASGGASGGGGAVMVLEALLRLRQAACHPGLVDPKRRGEPSAKLEALTESLAELIDEGHKVLVFSQFVEMLSIVRSRLEDLNITYEYLDGQTRDRKRRVDRFQADPECPVFLISLKAGGLGLNLTAAEYVFILDPWWNPAVEQQAIDRTHRIGQTRHVFAYRMICQDTVEHRIAELQQKKKLLADAIVGGDQSPLRNLTRDDLEKLLS